MTPEQQLSLAKAKAIHQSGPWAAATIREAEEDFGSAIMMPEDLLIVVFAPEAYAAEAGRDAVLAALAFAGESSKAEQAPLAKAEAALSYLIQCLRDEDEGANSCSKLVRYAFESYAECLAGGAQ